MHIPTEPIGMPFADDTSTSRDIAFEKIRARVEGTRLAEKALEKTQVAI